jgi:cytochrome c oxidase assembly protein subunit 15
MLLRRLLQLGFVLALVVVGASSTLRLSANGIGCSPWPACYGQPATATAVNAAPLARMLRLAHRIAASAFALLALVIVALGWRNWIRPARAVAILLLAVTAVLAAVGRYTPSPLPAVTLVNLLGGLALLALLAYLLAAEAPASRAAAGGSRGAARGVGFAVLIAAFVLQSGIGALISARLAGDACASGCGTIWSPGAAVLADPLRPGTAADLMRAGAGQPLHALHRLGGVALTVIAVPAIFALLRRRPRAGAVAMLAVAATAGLGFIVASPAPALAASALHALAAGAVFATLGAALALRAAPSQEMPT